MISLKSAILVAIVCTFTLPLYAQNPTPPAERTPRINARQMHQQRRIKEGVKSGELTPHETRTLEKREAKIERDKEKAKSDGVVTPQEKAKITREQNRTSRAIFRKKHNLRER